MALVIELLGASSGLPQAITHVADDCARPMPLARRIAARPSAPSQPMPVITTPTTRELKQRAAS
jgi:hypothetical protein